MFWNRFRSVINALQSSRTTADYTLHSRLHVKMFMNTLQLKKFVLYINGISSCILSSSLSTCIFIPFLLIHLELCILDVHTLWYCKMHSVQSDVPSDIKNKETDRIF
jgi:hypothetical protein